MTLALNQAEWGLPEGWSFDRLKDVVSLRNAKTDERSEIEDYLELEDMESGTGKILNRRNTLEVESAVTLFKKGDVLFGKLRPYLEKYYEAEFDGKCTGEILAFKPERIHSGYLRYCIASPWFIERCNMLAYGTKMPRINWPTQLSQFNLPIPPISEQLRIAAYLDASCKAINAAVAAKQEQIETLDKLFQSTVQAKTNNADTSWRRDKIFRLSNLIGSGGTPDSHNLDFYDGSMPWVQTGDLNDGILHTTSKSVTEEALNHFSSRCYPAGTLLIAMYGATIGKLSLLDMEATVNQACCAIVPRPILDVRFLFYKLMSMRKQLIALGRGGGQQNISQDTIKQAYITYPHISEQKRIVEEIEHESAQSKQIMSTITAQIYTLTAYRKSLIHECVTGQRRITAADIERVQTHA
jgi:type I restriction enzyme S subunit